MGSTVIDIRDGETHVHVGVVAIKESKMKKFRDYLARNISFLIQKKNRNKHVTKKVIHSIKVAIALVLVSLLYLVDPLYNQVGDNAMWAIMTVVVIFEFYAGAVLSKGLNRGIGTILGGGLGLLAAALAQEMGGVGNAIIVGISVFIFGGVATYTRLVPSIKKKYDYGVMIFILTFSLVAVSGLRADEKVLKIARERLSTIVMGFAVCIFISLLVFPIWASDELHESVASRFDDLATSIEGCFEEFFRIDGEKKHQPSFNFSSCKSVLHSKSKDELLVNFATWEPWHGKFGFNYPWQKYLTMGGVLRDLAVTIHSFKGCLQSPNESSQTLRATIKEPCEVVGSSLAWSIRELGESIMTMRRCETMDLIMPKLKLVRQELSVVMSPSTLGHALQNDGLEIAAFLFTLMEIVHKVEELTKEVEELGELAEFRVKM